MTTDNVLFQTFQTIYLPVDSSLVQYFRRLLERCGGHKAVRLQSGTCDTLKDLVGCSRNSVTYLDQLKITAFQHTILISQLTCSHDLSGLQCLRISRIGNNFLAPDTIVLVHYLQLINNLLLQEASISRINHLYLTHHLTNDNLEVLIVDLHTL